MFKTLIILFSIITSYTANSMRVEDNSDPFVEISMFSDIQGPFCQDGLQTMKELIGVYGNRIHISIKHLPLDFHKYAFKGALYFEALKLQDKKIAVMFYESILSKRKELEIRGEELLKDASKALGANMKKLMTDLHLKKIIAQVNADKAEAKKWHFKGTPSFVLKFSNGSTALVQGSYNKKHFIDLIEKIK